MSSHPSVLIDRRSAETGDTPRPLRLEWATDPKDKKVTVYHDEWAEATVQVAEAPDIMVLSLIKGALKKLSALDSVDDDLLSRIGTAFGRELQWRFLAEEGNKMTWEAHLANTHFPGFLSRGGPDTSMNPIEDTRKWLQDREVLDDIIKDTLRDLPKKLAPDSKNDLYPKVSALPKLSELRDLSSDGSIPSPATLDGCYALLDEIKKLSKVTHFGGARAVASLYMGSRNVTYKPYTGSQHADST